MPKVKTKIGMSPVKTVIGMSPGKNRSRQRSGNGAIRKKFPLQKPILRKHKASRGEQQFSQ